MKYIEAQKWDWETRTYGPAYLIDMEKTPLICKDMIQKVECSQCGREITYGECYTSQEVHDASWGFGFPVCPKCHEEELERRIKYDDRQRS